MDLFASRLVHLFFGCLLLSLVYFVKFSHLFSIMLHNGAKWLCVRGKSAVSRQAVVRESMFFFVTFGLKLQRDECESNNWEFGTANSVAST